MREVLYNRSRGRNRKQAQSNRKAESSTSDGVSGIRRYNFLAFSPGFSQTDSNAIRDDTINPQYCQTDGQRATKALDRKTETCGERALNSVLNC